METLLETSNHSIYPPIDTLCTV